MRTAGAAILKSFTIAHLSALIAFLMVLFLDQLSQPDITDDY
jgi:hypothetical protein